MNMLDRLVTQASGPRPNRPLLALTTLLFPGQYMSRLYASTEYGSVDWGEYQAAATISFDVDLPGDIEALPWLLDVLASYPFRVSFACIGRWVEQEPDVHSRIVDDGHEVINHTYSHPWSEVFNPRAFLSLNEMEQREEIQRGHEAIVRELGCEPVGFRAPHLDLSASVYPILAEIGYRYSSSALSRRTGMFPFQPAEGTWEFPLAQCPRHPSSVFDTYHAFRSKSWLFRVRNEGEEGFFDSFVHLLRSGMEHGTYVNFCFDPMDVRRFRDFRRFLDFVWKENEALKIGTYSEVVEILDSLE